MNKITLETLFKKTSNVREARADQTTRTAMGMLAEDRSTREAKTDRLRLLRLASEATRPAAAPKPMRKPIQRRGNRG